MAAKEVIVLTFCLSAVLSAMPGGWKAVDIGTDDAKDIANTAVVLLERRSNSMYRNKLVKLTSAKVQVVAGWKYELSFDVGVSDCLKNQKGKDLESCGVTGVEHCTVNVWVQPWLNSKKLTYFKCDPVEDAVQQSQEEETNEIEPNANVLQTMFQQARGNVDMIMNQIPNLPKVQTEQKTPDMPKEEKKPILGGDDHDIGNYGEFLEFKTKHNKKYDTDAEEKKRFHIFQENMKKARKLQEMEKGDATYGASVFADLSEKEFRKYYLSPKWDLSEKNYLKQAEIPTEAAPDAYDWRDHNAVTEVKNQGMCGSCWAFSVTGNVEGQYAIKNGSLLSFSEQELVDCDKVDEGCNGGLPIQAYEELKRIGGLETEQEYPYEGKGEKCAFKKTDARVQISGGLNISSNEDDMKAWLAKNGPISIGINANAMQFYMGGVSHPWSIFCNPDSLDHGVLIVGYGTQKSGLIFKTNTPYWIVKNSWGPSWGEKGYYLVYRGGGTCGLNKMPTSATIA